MIPGSGSSATISGSSSTKGDQPWSLDALSFGIDHPDL
jgi:hypothetical protein